MSDAGFEKFKELLASGIVALSIDNASRSALINIDDVTLNNILLNIWNGARDQSEMISFELVRRIGF